MAKVRFQLNLAGLNELMKSAEMKAILEANGKAVANHAEGMSGEAYDTRVHDASWVSICNVFPATDEARSENYKNNTVVKALGSSGLPMHK